jgi:hypothetical protein
VNVGSGPRWEETRRQYKERADEFMAMDNLFVSSSGFLLLFVIFSYELMSLNTETISMT